MSFSFSLYVSGARNENIPRTGSVDITVRRINSSIDLYVLNIKLNISVSIRARFHLERVVRLCQKCECEAPTTKYSLIGSVALNLQPG